MRLLIVCVVAALAVTGCGSLNTEVTQSDAEKNKKEFSQESYEDAMRKAGKGAELDAEKKRNEAYLNGGGKNSSGQ